MFKNLKINSEFKLNSYLYKINYPLYEESLCNMEMKYLFNNIPKNKYFFSQHYVDPQRSPFIKQCISIIYKGHSIKSIVRQISDSKLCCENFKVEYANFNDKNDKTFGFHEMRKIEYHIGMSITGEAELENPEVTFGITQIDGVWVFGKYKTNKLSWKIHQKKPYSYSNALNVRVARALVNIAISNNLKSTVIDPCCGIGTVVMEAISMGVNIKGLELNPMIAGNAMKNLEYFHYEPVIKNGNMHNIQDKFDVSIIDIPYGLFSPTTLKEQLDIIKTARRISDKSIIVTLEDMDEYIISAGFHIVDKCCVSKGTFTRHITICK